MSFMKSLKGLADDFKDLMGDKDKEKDKQQGGSAQQTESHRGASDSYYQQNPQQTQPQYGQPQYPPQQHNYGQSTNTPQQQQYGGPPQQGYGAPPPGSHLPPGWIQQWDQNSQRYYYLEQATGRSQWEPPAASHPGGEQSRAFGSGPPPQHGYNGGYDQNYNQGYGNHGYPQQGYPSHPGGQNFPVEAEKDKKEKKNKKQDSGKGGMIAAGAGGLLVGGLAGAALAGDSSDDESRPHAAPTGGYGAPPAGYGAPPAGYGAPPAGYQDPYGAPPGDPQALEHNSDVSSSQRESLEEARHEYERAQREAADSDASSSDHEAAEEARREYEEEIEEAEEEAYDD